MLPRADEKDKKPTVPPLNTSLTVNDESKKQKTPKTPKSPLRRVFQLFSPKQKPDKRKEKEKKHNEMVAQEEFERAFDRMMKDPANDKQYHVMTKKQFKRRSQNVSDLLHGLQPAINSDDDSANDKNEKKISARRK